MYVSGDCLQYLPDKGQSGIIPNVRSHAATILNGNVAVYEGLFWNGHVIVITVYTFLSVYYHCFELATLGAYISLSTIVSLGIH